MAYQVSKRADEIERSETWQVRKFRVSLPYSADCYALKNYGLQERVRGSNRCKSCIEHVNHEICVCLGDAQRRFDSKSVRIKTAFTEEQA